MNNIHVPAAYKHLTVTEKVSTEDYKPRIRSFIESRPNIALTAQDFNKALDRTSAMSHVKKLMRQGYITRKRIYSGRGKRFSYKWHAEPLTYEQAALKSGLPITKSQIALPTYAFSAKDLDNLTVLFTEWIDTLPQPLNGDSIAGAVNFRRWLGQRLKEVEKERKQLLEAKNA
jgi:hypothetical protein